MTKEQWIQITMGLKSVYTESWFLPDKESVNTWYEILKDLPYKETAAALTKYMQTDEEHAPKPATIRRLVDEFINGAVQDWGAGWEKVQLAIRKYGYYNEEEALASLDEITRECVKRLGFKTLCTTPIDDFNTSARANFRMIYNEISNKAMELRKMSPELKALAGNTLQMLEGGA